MTKNPVAVKPEDTVVYAAGLLAKGGFNGLPVTDQDRNLIGIITEFDLVSGQSALHLPTLINVFRNIKVYKKDAGLIKDDLKKLFELRVGEVMNKEPIVVNQEATIEEALDIFAHHHRVNPIPVLDDQKKLVGILSRFDLVKLLANEKFHQERTIVSSSDLTDKRVERFVGDFEKKFIFVSKSRTKLWLIISLSFLFVGFFVALATVIRVTLK